MKLHILLLTILYLFSSAVIFAAEETIIYSRLTDNYWQLWEYQPQTQNNSQLTDGKTDKRSPCCDNERNRILYRTPNGKLFSFNPANKESKELYPWIQSIADEKIFNHKLVFTRCRTNTIDDSDIWQIDLVSGEQTVLTNQEGLQYHPYLLAGKEILFYVSGTYPKEHHIYRKDLKTGKIKQLTFHRGYQLLPQVSRNKKNLLYVSDINGNYDIWKMNTNGQNKQQLTDHTGIDTYPCWSPNGKRIVYVSYRNGKYCLMLMDPDGRNQKLLFDCQADCTEPDWVKTK